MINADNSTTIDFVNLASLKDDQWVSYDGEFKRGKRDGYGVLVFTNEHKYHG